MINKEKNKKASKTFRFKSRVIVWQGSGKKDDSSAWRFARVPEDISIKIRKHMAGKPKRGWGAVYVDAKVGRTTWRTSVFPDKRSGSLYVRSLGEGGTYLLPLKKEVRYEENLYDGVEFNFRITI